MDRSGFNRYRAYGMDWTDWLDWRCFYGYRPYGLDGTNGLDGSRLDGYGSNRMDWTYRLDRTYWRRQRGHDYKRYDIDDGVLPGVYVRNVRHRVEHLHVECEAALQAFNGRVERV